MTATKNEPQVRVRISHAHTLKDGWRCDGTTVEWDGDWSNFDPSVIADLMELAHKMAVTESEARNNHIAATAQ